MLFLRALVNLFLVPVISLVIIYKKDGCELKPTFVFLLKYCLAVSCNIPLTRCITFFAKILSGMEIEADSSYYTVCAIVSAFLLAELVFIYKEFRKGENEQTDDENNCNATKD